MASLDGIDYQDVLDSLFANPPVTEAKPNPDDDVMMTSVNRHNVQQQQQQQGQQQWYAVRHHLQCFVPPVDQSSSSSSSSLPGNTLQRPNLSRPLAARQWSFRAVRESTHVTSSRRLPVMYGDYVSPGHRITAVSASAPAAQYLNAPATDVMQSQPSHLSYQRQYEDDAASFDVQQSFVSRHVGNAVFSHIYEGTRDICCYRASVRQIFLQGWPVTFGDIKRFSDGQLSILFRYFERQLYPSAADYDHLASLTGLARQQVITWFRNHRAAWRRRMLSYAMQTVKN